MPATNELEKVVSVVVACETTVSDPSSEEEEEVASLRRPVVEEGGATVHAHEVEVAVYEATRHSDFCWENEPSLPSTKHEGS